MGGDRLPGLGQAGADLGQRRPHGVPDLGRIVPTQPGGKKRRVSSAVGHVGHPAPLIDDEGADAVVPASIATTVCTMGV